MRIFFARNLPRSPSIVLAFQVASSWTIASTNAFAPLSVSALRSAPSIRSSSTTFTSAHTHFRGGSILNASSDGSINGENPKDKGSSSNSAARGERPATGWNHNLPDPSSPFWEGEKELPKNLNPSAYQSSKGKKERAKTGWLHNTSKNSAST
jgi:hypothetical protein